MPIHREEYIGGHQIWPNARRKRSAWHLARTPDKGELVSRPASKRKKELLPTR